MEAIGTSEDTERPKLQGVTLGRGTSKEGPVNEIRTSEETERPKLQGVTLGRGTSKENC